MQEHDRVQHCLEQVRRLTDFQPQIAVVLGSGLGALVDCMEIFGEISYADIDGFPVSTAPGHAGKFVYGRLSGKHIICMKGRIHFYEGYTPEDVVLPLRLMQRMGADTVILTNAAGGLHPDFRVGDLMMLTDHISLFVKNPLIGKNEEAFGERFPDMSTPYDRALCDTVRGCAIDLGIPLKEGVYVQLSGPSYETPAETRLLRSLGADAVGMSTVMETIAARHMHMRVCAISCICNMAFDLSGQEPNEEEVIQEGKRCSERFSTLLREMIRRV